MSVDFKKMLQEANKNSIYQNIGQIVGGYITQSMLSEEDEKLKNEFLQFVEKNGLTLEMTLEDALNKL